MISLQTYQSIPVDREFHRGSQSDPVDPFIIDDSLFPHIVSCWEKPGYLELSFEDGSSFITITVKENTLVVFQTLKCTRHCFQWKTVYRTPQETLDIVEWLRQRLQPYFTSPIVPFFDL